MKILFDLIAVVAIISLGAIVYSNTFFSSFHFDDQIFIINNFAIRNIHHLLHYWAYYPCRFIVFLSLAVNYHFGQLDVFGYHVFNLAVHLATAILVWWLTLLTLSTPGMKGNKITGHAGLIALLAGLVFVSHPLQTEAVTYIWQRAASLATFFYLASLCLYIKSRSLHSPSLGRSCYMASLSIAVVAMFTKENTITLPLMIALYELIFLKDRKGLSWGRLTPFLLTLLIIPLTIWTTKASQFQVIQKFAEAPGGTSPTQYLFTQSRVMVSYIRLVFLPFGQSLDHDFSISKSIFEWPVLFSALFLASILFFAKQIFLKYRLVSFSIFWFFLTLLPESSVLPLKNIIFEHRLYLPMVGYSLFLVSGLYYLIGKDTVKTMVIVLAMIITMNSILTFQRNKVWANEITLWNDTVQKSPHKARPYTNRGLAYLHKGDFGLAMADFNKAIGIDPGIAEAYFGRGLVYFHQGDLIQAISDYNKAVELNPDYAQAYYSRGLGLVKLRRLSEAVADFDKAIEIDPGYEDAYNNRGIIYAIEGDLPQARSDFLQAIEIDPNDAKAHDNLRNVDGRSQGKQ